MDNVLYYINILNRSDLKKYTLMGLNSEILLSKELFKYNSEISTYLLNVFDIQFRPYVMQSRTMIVARITREIYKYNDKQVSIVRKRMLKYFKSINIKEKSSKSESNNDLLSWY